MQLALHQFNNCSINRKSDVLNGLQSMVGRRVYQNGELYPWVITYSKPKKLALEEIMPNMEFNFVISLENYKLKSPAHHYGHLFHGWLPDHDRDWSFNYRATGRSWYWSAFRAIGINWRHRKIIGGIKSGKRRWSIIGKTEEESCQSNYSAHI